jgi:hypothetical protein
MTVQKDVFLCHASEDKVRVVKPLAKALDGNGIRYWLDEAEIRWGYSIVEKVNEGLRSSQFVLVVLSEVFLLKKWPKRELNAALNLEASTGTVRVLPLLYGNAEQRNAIKDAYPILDDKAFMTWDQGIPQIIDALKSSLSNAPSPEAPARPTSELSQASIPIPKVSKGVTQREKDRFLRDAFQGIVAFFRKGAIEVNRELALAGIEIDVEEIHNQKFVCNIYRNGSIVNRCKIWLGGLGSSDKISYFAGRNIDFSDDNSLNDWLTVDAEGSEMGFRKSNMGFEPFAKDFEGIISVEKAAEYLWLKVTGLLEYTYDNR